MLTSVKSRAMFIQKTFLIVLFWKRRSAESCSLLLRHLNLASQADKSDFSPCCWVFNCNEAKINTWVNPSTAFKRVRVSQDGAVVTGQTPAVLLLLRQRDPGESSPDCHRQTSVRGRWWGSDYKHSGCLSGIRDPGECGGIQLYLLEFSQGVWIHDWKK